MYVAAVIVIGLWLGIRWRYGGAPMPNVPLLRVPWLVPACSVLTLFLFAAQLETIDFIAHRQSVNACFTHLPVPVVADFSQSSGGAAMLVPGAVLAVLAAVQTSLLVITFIAASQRPPQRIEWLVTLIAFACAIAAAIGAPAMTSTDPFLYFSYSKIGLASFAAGPLFVKVPDFPIQAWCGKALLPSAYGPAFIAYVGALLGGVHSAAAGVLVLRAAGALWLLATVAALHRIGISRATIAIFALNPAVLFQYVTNAHNDLMPICLLAYAIAFAEIAPIAGIALVVLAGLAKLPFLAVGAVAFAQLKTPKVRLIATSVSIVLGLAISLLWAGPNYFAGLAWYRGLLEASGNRLELVLTAGALAVVAFAILTRASCAIGAYLFPGLTQAAIQPWYCLWGLPYAIYERSRLHWFIAALPLAALLMDDSVPRAVQGAVYGLTICAVMYLAARDVAYRSKPHERASS